MILPPKNPTAPFASLSCPVCAALVIMIAGGCGASPVPAEPPDAEGTLGVVWTKTLELAGPTRIGGRLFVANETLIVPAISVERPQNLFLVPLTKAGDAADPLKITLFTPQSAPLPVVLNGADFGTGWQVLFTDYLDERGEQSLRRCVFDPRTRQATVQTVTVELEGGPGSMNVIRGVTVAEPPGFVIVGGGSAGVGTKRGGSGAN